MPEEDITEANLDKLGDLIRRTCHNRAVARERLSSDRIVMRDFQTARNFNEFTVQSFQSSTVILICLVTCLSAWSCQEEWRSRYVFFECDRVNGGCRFNI